MTEDAACWDIDTEKLLCHMVLDDTFAPLVSSQAAPAFWRAFIVQNRTTGQIKAKIRWNYKVRGRSWTHMTPGPTIKDPMNHCRRALENVLCQAMERMGIDMATAAKAIESFYPPDDEGDPMKTIAWLQERDLVTEPRFEPLDPQGENN